MKNFFCNFYLFFFLSIFQLVYTLFDRRTEQNCSLALKRIFKVLKIRKLRLNIKHNTIINHKFIVKLCLELFFECNDLSLFLDDNDIDPYIPVLAIVSTDFFLNLHLNVKDFILVITFDQITFNYIFLFFFLMYAIFLF